MSTRESSSGESNHLERTASQISTASRKKGTVRVGSRKHSLVTPTSAKTLESFPSLSPEASPGIKSPQPFFNSPAQLSPNEALPKHPKQKPSTVQSLITSTPSFSGRTALFEDSPKGVQPVPGALHLAKDSDIKRLIEKNGAITLVRQLAEDVAQRDAELTDFRRRAEERERELKKMLREVEVSNLDIETRLHRVGNVADRPTIALQDPPGKGGQLKVGAREKITPVTNGIDQMMGEALKDDVGRISTEIDEGYLDSMDSSDKQATVKARTSLSKGSDSKSVASSVDSYGRANSTVRGWKDYFWSANGTSSKNSRASSIVSDYNEEAEAAFRTRGVTGNNGRQKLKEDLFQPPPRASTIQSSGTDPSRKSSMPATPWSLTKLFAGKPQANRGSDTIRGRSATIGSENGKPTRTTSTTSAQEPTTAQAALMKVRSMESSTNLRARITPLPIGLPGTTKTNVPQVQAPTSPHSVKKATATNSGPVEMDTIHDEDTKPPTLSQLRNRFNGSTELLTDRFGFIYDQRRRKREAETSAGHSRSKSNVSMNIETIGNVRDSLKMTDNDQLSQRSKRSSFLRPDTPASGESAIEDKPPKRWSDYLKVATFPTELLSHTPSPQPATTVIDPDTSSPRIKRTATGSLEPQVSPVTAGKAEIAQSSSDILTDDKGASGQTDAEPVKLLLGQLTELHDTLQREKTVKWNEFLRKIRAERRRQGETAVNSDSRSKQASTMPEITLTDGEMIGVAGLGNKGKVGRAKWNEFKHLVLAGIPVAYRAKIWAECSGASALRVPGHYDDLVMNGADDANIVLQIEMDINRTLTDNIFFRKGPGVIKLKEVLLAYSRRNPEVGYCQGMNLITASLLLIMPTAEDAFWVLTSMIENILPRHYYDRSLLASRADQQVLRQYVTELLPKLSAHLDDLGVELDASTFQWFLSVFTDCLSAEALFRVWDVVLCFNDGSTFLFQVALALLKLNERELIDCDAAAKVYSYVRNEMTDHAISIDGLIGASDALKGDVRREEVERRRWDAVEKQRGRDGLGAGRRREGSSVDEDGREGKGRERAGTGQSSGKSSVGELTVQEPRPLEGENVVR